MSNSNENAAAPPIAKPTDKRLGRTALIVLLITLVTSGCFAGIAFGMGVDAATQDALAALLYPIAGVGVLWSVILSVRAMRMGEPFLYTGIALFILLWGATVPLAATWFDSKRGSTDHYYIVHFLCLPVVIPLMAMAVTIALPLYFWKRRKALRAVESERSRMLRQSRIWFLAPVLLITVCIGPLLFYAYGSTMGYAGDSQIWSYTAVEYMPRWMGDVVYRVWSRLPKKARGLAPEQLAKRGLISSDFHYAVGMDAKSRAVREVLEYFVKHHPEEAIARAREAFSRRDYSNPIFNIPMGEIYFRLASREELVELCRVEHASKFPKDFQVGLLFGAQSSGKFKSEILEAARTWYFSKIEPIASFGRRLLLTEGLSKDVLLLIQRDVDARDYKSLEQVMRYIRPRKSAEVWDVLLTLPDENALASVHSIIFNDRAIATELAKKKNLPELLRPLLENSKATVCVGTALVVLFLKDQITTETKAQYFADKRKSNRVQVDPVKLSAVSDVDNNAVVEQARELLKKW